MSRGTSLNPDKHGFRNERGANRNAGVLETPGPIVLRRKNNSNPGSRGGRRSTQEIFNRAHALWAGKEYRTESGVLSNARCRQIRRKIRRALYSEDDEARFEKETMTYREASRKHGVRLHALRRRLDASFYLLEMAEDSWAADLFIQEVFQIDRIYQPAADGWVHPRQRSRALAVNSALEIPSTRRISEGHRTLGDLENGPLERSSAYDPVAGVHSENSDSFEESDGASRIARSKKRRGTNSKKHRGRGPPRDSVVRKIKRRRRPISILSEEDSSDGLSDLEKGLVVAKSGREVRARRRILEEESE